MLAPKSLFDLIVPTSMESFDDIDETAYPFSVPLNLGDYDLEGAQELVAEICEWLDTTIGHSSKWNIGYPPSWWADADNDEINMVFLFKKKGDAVAFKLRWL